MAKYRKKPVEVDAVKYDFNNSNVIVDLMDLAKDKHPDCHLETRFEWDYVLIRNPDGVKRAELGDYIVKENGMLYPSKPDIFEKIYERVE